MTLDKRRKYLLACLAEECGEATQMAGKCLRFGIDSYHKKTGNISNMELLRREVNDIIAVAEMLNIDRNEEDIVAKQAKVAKWMYNE